MHIFQGRNHLFRPMHLGGITPVAGSAPEQALRPMHVGGITPVARSAPEQALRPMHLGGTTPAAGSEPLLGGLRCRACGDRGISGTDYSRRMVWSSDSRLDRDPEVQRGW